MAKYYIASDSLDIATAKQVLKDWAKVIGGVFTGIVREHTSEQVRPDDDRKAARRFRQG